MSDTRLTKQDPREQYPKPPFPKQPQPAPGIASEMIPKPDHGEESYVGHGRLEGRKALITGGDSGIGRAVAIAFAREGADVAISYLPAEEKDAQEVIALIKKAGRKAVAIPGDITTEGFCVTLVAAAVTGLGGLDILVNNAGKQVSTPSLLEITTEQFDLTMKTNLYALFWITKAAFPHLTPGSAIINTTSIQGYEPSEDLVDYAMTKAAIADFTKSVAKQGIEKGIRVNGIARPVLDAAAIERRQHAGEGREIRRLGSAGSSGPAGRDRARVRAARLAGGQLHHRRDLRRHGRNRHRLNRAGAQRRTQAESKREQEGSRPMQTQGREFLTAIFAAS